MYPAYILRCHLFCLRRAHLETRPILAFTQSSSFLFCKHSMAAERNRETDQLLAQPDSEELSERRTQPQSTFRRAVVWVLIVEFVSAFPYYLLVAPKLKLLELTICRIYYDDHNPTVVVSQPLWPGYTIEESLCKQRVIQQGLSDLRSWSAFLEGLCGMLPSR